jgi:hypothetical protein
MLSGGSMVFNMTGGKISGNKATDGGVVYVYNAIFDMRGGEITDNTADNCGGMYLSGNNILDATGKICEDPSVGTKVAGKGSIYGNKPNDRETTH